MKGLAQFEDDLHELARFVRSTGLAAPKAKDALERLEGFRRMYENLDLIEGAPADARALWAVRVLDAWRKQSNLHRTWKMGCPFYGESCILLDTRGYPDRACDAADEDTARLAASDAVWPELPADVRARIGERP